MTNTNKIIISIITTFVFFITLLMPKAAFASPWDTLSLVQAPEASSNLGKVMSLKEGERAPFAGVLFDVAAAAKLEVEKESQQERCEIKVEKEVGLKEAKLNLRLANEIAARESLRQQLTETRRIRDEQVEFLNKQLQKQSKRSVRDLTGLWISVGVVSGVLLTLAGAYAVKQVGQ